MGGRDLENGTIEVMRVIFRKETVPVDGIVGICKIFLMTFKSASLKST